MASNYQEFVTTVKLNSEDAKIREYGEYAVEKEKEQEQEP